SFDMRNPGHPLPNITTGGQPSLADLEKLKQQGVKAVFTLRRRFEEHDFDEQAAVEALGMTFVRLPIAGQAGVTMEAAKAFDDIMNGLEGKALVHCGSSNRVGALFALRAYMNGASSDEAMKLGEKAGLTRLKPIVEGLMATK
ncbi:MAG: hypothetical protein KAI28_12365, partial [Sphingomonadales bacterium]|nr:hypothetical protein [Sphingomonadales bacterium]